MEPEVKEFGELTTEEKILNMLKGLTESMKIQVNVNKMLSTKLEELEKRVKYLEDFGGIIDE